MTAHFVGMFALVPFAGLIVARRGAVPSITFGLALLMAGAAGTALSPASRSVPIALSLFVGGDRLVLRVRLGQRPSHTRACLLRTRPRAGSS
jgi:hypothetical protein